MRKVSQTLCWFRDDTAVSSTKSTTDGKHPEISPKRSMNTSTMLAPLSSKSSNHLDLKPSRRCRSASPAPPKAPLLSTEQQNLIRKSWQRVSKTAIGKSIYARMIAKYPDSKSLFANDASSISRHERYFVDLLQSAVDNLKDMKRALQPWLECIGKGHSGFSIRVWHWDAFGEAVVSAITEWIGPGKTHRETIRAWMLLSSFVSDHLGVASRKSATSNEVNGNLMWTPRIHLLTLVTSGPTAQ